MSVSETATGLPYRVVTPSAMQESLEDGLGDRSRDDAAEAVRLLLEHDRHRDLRVVGRSEADEPRGVDARDPRLGRPRLAGDLDAGDLSRRAGAALDHRHHQPL